MYRGIAAVAILVLTGGVTLLGLQSCASSQPLQTTTPPPQKQIHPLPGPPEPQTVTDPPSDPPPEPPT